MTGGALDARVDEAVRAPYVRVFVKQADGGFSAHVPELPGVNAGGASIDECNVELDAAIEDWVSYELGQGREIPTPQGDGSFARLAP